MVPVRKLAVLLAFGILGRSGLSGPTGPSGPSSGPTGSTRRAGFASASSPLTAGAGSRTSLFTQSAAQILDREFSRLEISFLLLDARTGVMLASRWEEPEKPIPLGSLIKPFTALAYAEAHEFHYPDHVCRGQQSGCWLPRGHGNTDVTSAIANSCNSYFRMLTADMRGEDVAPVARRSDWRSRAPSYPALS